MPTVRHPPTAAKSRAGETSWESRGWLVPKETPHLPCLSVQVSTGDPLSCLCTGGRSPSCYAHFIEEETKAFMRPRGGLDAAPGT